MQKFDVMVIGGGHAGTEAAHAAARLGCRTGLISLKLDRIGFMSCNPAMGGLAKGQLVKEIDALGGIMARQTDKAAIQYRQLNSSKGPAVRSSRAQCDKHRYASEMQSFLSTVDHLTILEGEVERLLIEKHRVSGVVLKDGTNLLSDSVVITSGTFMRALMYTGFESHSGGRAGDQASLGLSASLESLGFRLGRLKTGTPPRLHRQSIDYSRLEAQAGDPVPRPFSFFSRPSPFPLLPQVNCHITYTNARTHDLIEANFDKSPMFTGLIQGVGPRYCPSIEDKVKRFRERERHQIFLEPEGLATDEVYVNGISTSLPSDVQSEFVHSIVGLEMAEFVRFGYAVEYDCVDARQLRVTFESKDVSGLFFAGQVNGTSGYEEAGAQGLIAGVNAAHSALHKDPFVLTRLDGYMGVLADDLVTMGADEPYRMFTSRAEYRLLLREDNADLRLSGLGHRIGLLSDSDFAQVERKREQIEKVQRQLDSHFLYPRAETQAQLAALGTAPLKDRVSADVLLRRPEMNWARLVEMGFQTDEISAEVSEQAEIQTKYRGYIQRDLDLLEGVRRSELMKIPAGLVYDEIPGLSTEIRGRLKTARPDTIGQASRLQGMTPAAVAGLMIHLKMLERI